MTHPHVCVGCGGSNLTESGLNIDHFDVDLHVNVCGVCAEALTRERTAFEKAIREVVQR